MRVTIIRGDKMVAVDGVAKNGIDMSSIPANVHAVQWYDTWGEVEYVDRFEPEKQVNGTVIPAKVVKPANKVITDIKSYQAVIELWRQAPDPAAQ